ncbi:hypothetical protein C8Q73DRAFT_709436 [Cubamyces lactineus]|nr:hypothetical protein C8Q73DRAFT_709436 [Cubamyces lactineus]
MAKTHYPKKRRSAAQRALAMRNIALMNERRLKKNSSISDAVAAATPESSSAGVCSASTSFGHEEDSEEDSLETRTSDHAVSRYLREAKQKLAVERQRTQAFQRELRNARSREKRLRVAVASLRDKLKEARMERQMEVAVTEARLREVEAGARAAVASADGRARAWEAWAGEAYVAGAQAEAHALRTRLVELAQTGGSWAGYQR